MAEGMNKWTLEICTLYNSEDDSFPNHILDLLTEESATPYFKSGFKRMSMNEAQLEFGIPEDHLRDYYETCIVCDREIDDEHEVNLDGAMYEAFDHSNIDTTGFVYCNERCRLLHVLQFAARLT